MTVYLDLADLIGLEFRCAVMVNDANASHQLPNSERGQYVDLKTK